MKYFFSVLILVALASADNDGNTDSDIGLTPQSSDSYVITLTLINDWSLTDKVLGLDVYEEPGQFCILGVDDSYGQEWIQAYDAATGTPVGTMSLSSYNEHCYGVAWNNNPNAGTYLTNDYVNSYLFYTEDFGTTWRTETNPAGAVSRGMDFDGTDYWTTNNVSGGLWRFQPGGCAEYIALPAANTRAHRQSGLTVFPYRNNLGVAVTTFNIHRIYFFEWDGSIMSYIGSAACPVSNIDVSHGLAYADTNGHMYWSYFSGLCQDYHLVEFSFYFSTIPSKTSLEHSTWGSIKSSF